MTGSPGIPLDGDDALPRSAAGRVFNEPWEAQAFALAVHLVESGYFDRSEWAEALGEEIKAAQARGDPDRGGTYYRHYYRHWLNALERLCAAKPRDAKPFQRYGCFGGGLHHRLSFGNIVSLEALERPNAPHEIPERGLPRQGTG